MRLSMWMIANRIVRLDPELQIRDDAPVCLHSARQAYAANCVYVYQEGTSVVCDGEGDKIILHDMDAGEAFELIQSVFDFYDEWYHNMLSVIASGDHQQIIDMSWLIFQNPVILLDADNKTLALSSQYGEDDVNREWKHLCQYGYSSIRYVRYFKNTYPNKDYYIKNRPQLFSFGRELEDSTTLSAAIYHKQSYCGRINILQHERGINPGDHQILDIMIPILADALNTSHTAPADSISQNVFLELIRRSETDIDKLRHRVLRHLQYMRWDPDDVFQIATVHIPDELFSQDLLVLLSNLIRKQLPKAIVFTADPCVVIIYDICVTKREAICERLKDFIGHEHLVMGISLPFKNLPNLRMYFEQTLFAIEYGTLFSPGKDIYLFYDYAMDYIIENSSMRQLLCACHPDIKVLYKEDLAHDSDRLPTLRAYLKNNGSLINTSKELFIHRNTLVYRINKITQMCHYDINDEYNRDYLKLSMHMVFLYRKRCPRSRPLHAYLDGSLP